MVEKVVKETFEMLFALIDIRQIYRETKPTYLLNSEQKEKVQIIIDQVRHGLDFIEKELL